MMIKTTTGWKPLWTMNKPERPAYPDATKRGDHIEKWRDDQHKVLLKLWEYANAEQAR